MLTIGIENDDKFNLSIYPVAQTGFDRFAFAPVFWMDNDFRAGRARVFRRFVTRTVIDNQNAFELSACPEHHFANVFLFLVSRNNHGDL